MNLSTLAVVLFAAAVSAYTEQEYRDAFTNWMQTYDRAYEAELFQAKYAIFKGHMDFVQNWNADPTTHVVELNQFADISNADFQRIYLGTRMPLGRPAPVYVASPAADAMNWTSRGAVTPVKNQGQCGSCWAFSTTGSTEGKHFLVSEKLVSLSEQQLVDCSSAYGNNGCNGGLMDDAFKYIIANKGIDTEESYPYNAETGSQCLFNPANVGATLTGFTDVQSGSEADLLKKAGEQPVSVAIDASHLSFQLYKKGVYNEKACSTTQLDHGVLVVGFGAEGTDDYWLVKNSWGAEWGMEGFLLMSRNKENQCGIATAASVPTA